MARIGLKGLTYAPITGGGDGSALTYSAGTTRAGLMMKADVTIEREDVKQFGDNAMVEHANGVTGGTIKLELTRLADTDKAALLGYTTATGNILKVVDADAPYVGFGYITKEIANGVISYIGYWYHKVQFGMDSDSAETKGENSAFQSVNLTGSIMGVQLTSGGAMEFYMTKSDATEAAIRTWLNGLAGISATT